MRKKKEKVDIAEEFAVDAAAAAVDATDEVDARSTDRRQQ